MYKQLILRRRVTALLMLLWLLPLGVWSQSIGVSSNPITVKALFAELEKQASVNLVYSDLGEELDKTVRLSRQTVSLQQLLNEVEKQTSLRFTINQQDVIVRRMSSMEPVNPYTSLTGQVIEPTTSLALGYATIHLRAQADTAQVYRTVAGSDGRFIFAAVPKGRYMIQASYVGYSAGSRNIQLQSNTELIVEMVPEDREVEEIHVTAVEQKGMTTSSIIKREAIDHLQATSLTDLMPLLPGGQSVPPDLTAPNLANLREANPAGRPASGLSSQYVISSLGTLFVVDDMPISTDANLQFISASSSTIDRGNKQYVNHGFDMRGIATDNIESVEIIRGIPSVRYGDLTSGVVKIDRMQKATPLQARFKVDQFSKLFSLSKGVALPNDWIVNADLSYLDGKSNPINPLVGYDRYTASIRSEKRWGDRNSRQLRWNTAIDYTGQFDDWKNDAEQMMDQETYKLSYKSTSFSSRLSLSQPKKLLRTLDFNVNARYSLDNIYRDLWPTNNQEQSMIPISLEEGVGPAISLPGKYLATHEVDGRPFNAFATLRGVLDFQTGPIKHSTQIGTEWRMDKNYGAGQIFDVARPVNNSFGVRPYRYDRVPANQQVSYYVEDHISLPKWHGSQLHIQAGLRGGTLLNLDEAYTLNGKIYNDPRINAQLELPAVPLFNKPLRFTVTGGIGWLTKMPTMSMLYPDIVYIDIREFTHVNSKPEYSYNQIRTYIEDRVNYDLSYTRNKKKEIRVDAEWEKHRLSITWFDEGLHNGFRSSAEPKAYYYRDYGLVTNPQYPEKPDLTDMPYEEKMVFRSTSKQSNGSALTKKGIEFTFETPRYPAIGTRFTARGAYFKNNYTNSQPMWFTGGGRNNPIVDGFVVFDNYAALYLDWREGFLRSRTSTSFTADTYIKRHGLTLSLTAETYWRGQNNQWDNNPGYPGYYLTTDNVLHDYTEADKSHEHRRYLFLANTSTGNKINNEPLTNLHFRGSKDFGSWLRLSLFVLNFADINSFYTDQQGVRVKDDARAPYFGMELKLKL